MWHYLWNIVDEQLYLIYQFYYIVFMEKMSMEGCLWKKRLFLDTFLPCDSWKTGFKFLPDYLWKIVSRKWFMEGCLWNMVYSLCIVFHILYGTWFMVKKMVYPLLILFHIIYEQWFMEKGGLFVKSLSFWV